LFCSEKKFLTFVRVIIFIFFCRAKRNFFPPEFNIRLYDKNSESYFFFPPPKSEYFFQKHWESNFFFLEKKHNLPPSFQVKWSFSYLNLIYTYTPLHLGLDLEVYLQVQNMYSSSTFLTFYI